MCEEYSTQENINVTEGKEIEDASQHLATKFLGQGPEPTPPPPEPITLPPGPIGTTNDPEPTPPDNDLVTHGE